MMVVVKDQDASVNRKSIYKKEKLEERNGKLDTVIVMYARNPCKCTKRSSKHSSKKRKTLAQLRASLKKYK